MDIKPIPQWPGEEEALDAVQRLRARGYQAYFAGGCVRDLLLGRVPTDIDITTSAPIEAVEALFETVHQTGRAFGVLRVRHAGKAFEIATFRRDLDYRDGRRPTGIAPADAATDAQRRDFTINGLFYDPLETRIIDHVGGIADLRARKVRAIGDAAQRFREDRLRMLRAARFAATLDFHLAPSTARAIRCQAREITGVSAERVRDELTRLLLEAPRAGRGIARLSSLGLLAHVLPEIEALRGVEQPRRFHPEGDVFRHTLAMLDAMHTHDPRLAYAVLLHDVGKPECATRGMTANGELQPRFDGHAACGAALAGKILRRLRLAGRDAEAVVHCIRGHMRFMDAPRMRKATLWRWIHEATFPLELELHRLDCLCSHGGFDTYLLLRRAARAAQQPGVPAPAWWVTGKDLLALGWNEGPELGRWLRHAQDAQVEGRCANRAELLAWLATCRREKDAP